MKQNAILALADGTILSGNSLGHKGFCTGEVVFNTSMTGYQEVLTDPSYAEQIITFTAPHIGNVGVNSEDQESHTVWARGMIIRQAARISSNWRATGCLQDFLLVHKIVAIENVDTRRLTHILRQKGSQSGCLMAGEVDPAHAIQMAQAHAAMRDIKLAEKVSKKAVYALGNPQAAFHVVVIDCGIKQSILHNLIDCDCRLTVMPEGSSYEEIAALQPHGVFLSNGPGDPAACQSTVDTTKILLQKKIPLFGICLGHQILALASGAKTVKMTAGHHGANHPILDLDTKQVMISSQNHGFVVCDQQLPPALQVTHRSLFDGTIAGLKHTSAPAFSFQGHPEASPGPHDLKNLFCHFTTNMRAKHA